LFGAFLRRFLGGFIERALQMVHQRIFLRGRQQSID
jgi:hypothetical protein